MLTFPSWENGESMVANRPSPVKPGSLLRCAPFGDSLTNSLNGELGAIGDELLAVFQGLAWRGHIEAVDAIQANSEALSSADGLRVNSCHDRFIMIVVMHTCPSGRAHVGLLMHANGLEIIIAPHVLGVILRDEMHDSCGPAPLLVQARGDRFHTSLVLTVVTQKDNVREAVLSETATDVCKQRLKGCFSHTDRARVLHVARGRRNTPFRDKPDDRRHQGIAKLARNGLGHGLEHIIVFPNSHIRTIGLEPTGTDDHAALPSPHGVAYFHPSEFFEEDTVDPGNRPRGLE